MKENEDKLLKDLLQSNKEEITAPDDFTDQVMAKIEAVANKKTKPIIGWPARIFFAACCVGIALVALLGGDLPADSWIGQLQLQDSVSNSVQKGVSSSIQFIEEYSLVGILIVTILTFMFADRVLRFRKKVSLK
ncbi:hypothetical protein JYT72_01765 [Crocinitomix catalasitica]|nr:hypothetical protein [Crocinitomix catalasitica]